MTEPPRLPAHGNPNETDSENIEAKAEALMRKRGVHLVPNLHCPRCAAKGSIYIVPEKIRLNCGNLDLPYFQCSLCACRWYDYAEMIAYVMAVRLGGLQ